MNVGKKFESAIQKSVPEYALIYRLPDAAQSFGGSDNLRFSTKNPFDYLLWDSQRHILYALELKTVNKKSISFERTKEDKGDIHWHQIRGLERWGKYNGITSGFIIEFREIETTVFIDINDFKKLITSIAKKSFNFNDLVNLCIPYFVIPQKLKRTNFTYDIEGLLSRGEKKF